MTIILYVLLSYVILSFVEYFGHRWIMHSPRGVKFQQHAVLHHGHYFPRGHFLWSAGEDEAAHFISIGTGPLPLWTSPIILILFAISREWAVVFLAMTIFHGALWTMIHREMHFARRGWLERSPVFRFLYHYHRVHHDQHRFNYNGLMPLADFVFRTYQRPA